MSVNVATRPDDEAPSQEDTPLRDDGDSAVPEQPADRDLSRGGKSRSAFRTISEVADDLDVAQHVLRFWESKFPQVRPLKRGGGRRYYRPEDVDILRRIRILLYDEGYTIKGAQRLLRVRRTTAPQSGPGRAPSESPLPAAVGEAAPVPDTDIAAPEAPTSRAGGIEAQATLPTAGTLSHRLNQQAVSAPVVAERRRLARRLKSELSALRQLLQAALTD